MPRIAGNCEEQLAAGADDCGCGFAEDSACNDLAKYWYAFARQRVSVDSRRWMASLPKFMTFSVAGWAFRVVHGGVARTNRFVFASQRALITEQLRASKADIVIAGYAGLPFIEIVRERVWFNPGVIGMPANDGTPRFGMGSSIVGAASSLCRSAVLPMTTLAPRRQRKRRGTPMPTHKRWSRAFGRTWMCCQSLKGQQGVERFRSLRCGYFEG